MPLFKGKSKKAFGENVATEMDSGKPQNQALAIAYNMKKKSRKMAEGGMMTNDGYQSEGKGHTIHINVHPQAGYDPMESAPAKSSSGAMHEDDEDFNQEHVHEMGMADGGVIKDLPPKEPTQLPEEEDMVGRIMSKRAGMYSEGGKVANQNSGESSSDPNEMAKSDPNEFDDLALRDDLDFSYSGENSGDEDGSELNQEDDDMVGRIMRKRSAKK